VKKPKRWIEERRCEPPHRTRTYTRIKNVSFSRRLWQDDHTYIASVNEINRPPFLHHFLFRMPRSFFFFAVVAVFVARYHATDAAKMKNEDVTCVCTKSPSNDVKIKVARCDIGTYYTACCNKAHPLFKGHCTYMAPSKSAAVKSDKKPVLGSDVDPIRAGLGGSTPLSSCKRNKDCRYENGCCHDLGGFIFEGVCGTWVPIEGTWTSICVMPPPLPGTTYVRL
jgi:hypothetical protein